MKILFPKLGEIVICSKCKNELVSEFTADESSDVEDRWCNFCTDFSRYVKVVKVQ